MYNFRQIDKKLYLSGGWTDIDNDPDLLAHYNVKAVVDLQYSPDDDWKNLTKTVENRLAEYDIDYAPFVLYDSDYNVDAREVFMAAADKIAEFIAQNADSKRDAVLIKCGAGLSRSVTALIWYLGYYRQMSYVQALDWYNSHLADYNPSYQPYMQTHAINAYFMHLLKKEFPE